MKLAFAHDHRFVRSEDGRYYSDGQLPYTILRRYLKHFDQIVVLARARNARKDENFERLNLTSGEGVSIVVIPDLNNIVLSPLNWVRAYRIVFKVLADCDALLARTSTIAFLCFLLFRKTGKPWAVEVVGCIYDSFKNHGSLVGRMLATMAAKAIKRMIFEAPYVFYVTNNFLQSRYPTLGRQYACSDVQLLQVNQDTLFKRRERYFKPIKNPKIGLIGSLVHKHKGIDTAIKAIDKLHQMGVNATLAILGSGDPAPWKKLAQTVGVEKFVHFEGTLPSGLMVQEWLNELDLYIQPSRLEGLPRALVEAMNQGCPVVASNVGGIPELLDADYMHPPESYEKLADLICLAIKTPGALLEMSLINKIKADEFSSEKLDEIRDNFLKTIREQCDKLQNDSNLAS